MMTCKFLYLCLIVYFTVIKSQKSGYIHLSVSAKNKSIVMNWRYNNMNSPIQVVLHEKGKEVLRKVIRSQQEKVSHMYTNIGWDHSIFPGNLYPNTTKYVEATKRCYQYEIISYIKEKYDAQCLMVNVQWMSRFPKFADLRLGDMYIPGTHHSGATGRHQNYGFWGQLVFGIRYFDIVPISVRNENGKLIFKTIYSPNLLRTQLNLLKRFMQITTKEVVILDFRGFYNFRGNKDHNLFINKVIRKYLGEWLANRDISNHRYGPKLSELWKNDKRIIINYRYEPMVAKYKFLWNDILLQSDRKTNPGALRNHMKETFRDEAYKEKMRAFVAVLDPRKNGDRKELADSVNPEISNWYNFDKIQKRINIIMVDFFEGSKIHIDAVWLNKNYH